MFKAVEIEILMIYFLFQKKRYSIMNDYYKQFEMLKFYFRD